MLFNTFHFAFFLPIVFILYWIIDKKKIKFQNVILLVSSYYFYSCWDYRFLFLLVFSTLLDFYAGIKIDNEISLNKRKFWFWLSVVINLGFLSVFKYYNFFVTSFSDLISSFGFHINPWLLNIILPVGISFYTFHGLSYVIDIYKNKISSEKQFVDYALFVSFFPLLVAGPIERATHLLPQLKQIRNFEYKKIVDGLRQILWGLFKKVVIADNCAEFANQAFNNSYDLSGSSMFLGAVFFSFQIYGDFSGYSDIALGTARLFGIELLKNFSYPYFSKSISEFWRKWHISLSSWFRDYVYIPLGGGRGSLKIKIRNTLIVFLLSGFWHGANWTFVFWGFLNALYILPSLFVSTENEIELTKNRFLSKIKKSIQMLLTFILVVFAWIFFRADNISVAFDFIFKIFDKSLFSIPYFIEANSGNPFLPRLFILILIVFIIVEWIGREFDHPLAYFSTKLPRFLNGLIYYMIICALFWFSGNEEEFIYFQF